MATEKQALASVTELEKLAERYRKTAQTLDQLARSLRGVVRSFATDESVKATHRAAKRTRRKMSTATKKKLSLAAKKRWDERKAVA